MRRKLRALELKTGAPPLKPGPRNDPVWKSKRDAEERAVAEQAEAAYRLLISGWQNSRPKRGAGATPERASQTALEGQGRATG